MELQEIKDCVDAGLDVRVGTDAYKVVKSISKTLNDDMKWEEKEDYNIVCLSNSHTIGLTWMDGVTLNAKEEDFYLKGDDDD